MKQHDDPSHTPMTSRFRGFFPVVVDVETGGFNANTDALLEIAAITMTFNEAKELHIENSLHFAVEPYSGLRIDPSALAFTGIKPNAPERRTISEANALKEIFGMIKKSMKTHHCNRAILVGHNAIFDHNFVHAAVSRNNIKRNPFHPFSCFDTVSLAGLAYGQTVLSRACKAAEIDFNEDKAHSALYDCEKTAELFCKIVNTWKELGGWPLQDPHN